jgi:erythromycin esterase-like protein
MADRISYLLYNSDSKIIVWAHNAHISNEIVTDNEIGIMGRNLKQEFKKKYILLDYYTKGSYSFIDRGLLMETIFYIDELKDYHAIN